MASFRSHVLVFVAMTIACMSSVSAADDTHVEKRTSILKKFLSKPSEHSQRKASNSDDNTIILKMGSSSKLNDYYLWRKFVIGDKKVLVLFEKKSSSEVAAEALGRVLATALIASICAYLYHSKKEYPAFAAHEDAQEAVPLTQWSSGLFDCCQDPYIFLCACCCMPIRWADTMDMVGLMKFWTAFAFVLVLQLCSEIPFLGFFWFGIVGVLAMHRQKLRGIFQIPGQGDGGATVGDAFFVCCCMPCAVAQEARHVELAAKLGHDAILVQRPIREGMENSEPGGYTGRLAEPTRPKADTVF